MKKIKELQHDIKMAGIVYSMNYADDARLTLLESKVNAIIEYLLNTESNQTATTESTPASYYGPQSKYSTWDELDKSHAARAKLHDELVIAEGQRDQARAERDALKAEVDTLRAQHAPPRLRTTRMCTYV